MAIKKSALYSSLWKSCDELDASKGFIKDGNKNRLRSQDIHKIVDAFTRQIEIPGYSRMVPHSEIEALESHAASAVQAIEELVEEHSGDEGLLEEAKNDNGKVTKGAVAERLKELADEPDANDERGILEQFLALTDQDAAIKGKIKTAQEALTEKQVAKYSSINEAEIKALVVEDKWLAAIENAIRGELDRVSQNLAGRVRELAERYAVPLPALVDDVERRSAKVQAHLANMGFSL